MSFKSFLKALTKLTFQRGPAAGSGAPFFGQNFELWDAFFAQNGNGSIDFATEIGDLRTSALLMAAHTWLSAGLSMPRITVVDLGNDNEETEVKKHPLVQLFKKPNPFYGSSELLSGVALDWLIYATAYILKVHGVGGQIVELYYWPKSDIRPVIPENEGPWISGYEININGEWRPWKSENVIVLRKGVDMQTRMGQSATSALLREYYTDRQAAEFAAMMMKQGLVPPMVVSVGSDTRTATPEQALSVKNSLVRQMSGKKVGEPVVTNADTKVNLLNFDYGKVGLRDVRAIPEERFCAAMGISPYSLHFGTSRQASTFSNVEQYLKHDYRAYIVPMLDYIAERFNEGLLAEFEETDTREIRWNYDQVPLMQADQTAEWNRIAEAYKARILDQAQALEAIGYKPEDSQKGVYFPVQASTTTANELNDAEINKINVQRSKLALEADRQKLTGNPEGIAARILAEREALGSTPPS